MRITRSPAMTYAWAAVSLTIVGILFAHWERFVVRGKNAAWWALLFGLLIVDYLFVITPIKDQRSIRRLSAAGKLWAASAWILVASFVIVAVAGTRLRTHVLEELQVSTMGLVLLALLVYAIYRLSKEWIRESLRSIAAREGGGFLIHFQSNEEIAAAIVNLPGAAPESASGENWSVPADPAAASALLQFAKKYDFEFLPQQKKTAVSSQ
jgi:hypothetical protein